VGQYVIEIVRFDRTVHTEAYRRLNIEHLTWAIDQLREQHGYIASSESGQTIPEYVDEHLEDLTRLHPPDGIIYLLGANGDIVGMGALRKLSDGVGEIKRMYIRPAYRGRGYGKQLLEQLLSAGRRFGCSTFLLDTPKFATAAQHIYRSAGFQERNEYPESEIPATFTPYWLFMEKIE
jgi:ribosomal protein S18 acetylase RimI-like enzyme